MQSGCRESFGDRWACRSAAVLEAPLQRDGVIVRIAAAGAVERYRFAGFGHIRSAGICEGIAVHDPVQLDFVFYCQGRRALKDKGQFQGAASGQSLGCLGRQIDEEGLIRGDTGAA